MWIDTHCHLDAAEFAGRETAIAGEAAKRDIGQIVIPSVDRNSFDRVVRLAHACENGSYALGIHPLYVAESAETDLDVLSDTLEQRLTDSKLVAIGEIGLDFYLPELAQPPLRDKQEHFLAAQLNMAKRFGLPVLLHTRRSVDVVLKQLKRHDLHLGIAHAFNGSFQQANAFVDQGFMLSFCGTVTYERAQQLRRLVTGMPLETIVIETDAPDLPPAWKNRKENSPLELPRIGEVIATLRGIAPEELAGRTTENALRALPRLGSLLMKG